MTKLKDYIDVNWQSEFNATAYKFHLVVGIVAAILNPLFAISDYFINNTNFKTFLILRIVVSIIILLALLFRKKFISKPFILGLIPYWAISVENAYMYSVMNVGELQQHTFSYVVLFIGAGMFGFWNMLYSILSVIASVSALIVLFILNSSLSFNEMLTNGGMLTIAIAILTIPLIYTRTNLTKREIAARLALAESNKELEIKNEIIEEKNKDIQDSINYAKYIQEAILPPIEKINNLLNDYFILYKPKDVVSGDFYWCNSVTTTPKSSNAEKVILLAAVDCTGHGVPGAMMSVIGNAILNQSITATNVNTPAEALNFLNIELSKNLNAIRDGMDMALVAINMQTLKLQYAGANNSVYIIRKNELIELFPDKMSIGGSLEEGKIKNFTNNTFDLKKEDTVYLFTDGYADQFGGPKGKKFKHKQLQDLLISVQDKPMKEQAKILEKEYESWKGNLAQVDDILVMGIKI